MRRAALVIGILFVSAVLMSQIAIAGQTESYNSTGLDKTLIRPYPVLPLAITEVYVDFGGNHIVISGKNFDNGTAPVVLLGNDPTPLTLVGTPTANEIIVELPAVPDGDYLLEVSTGQMGGSTSQPLVRYDSYDLTIGAVGPQGIQGPIGPKGDKGDKGDTGATGAVGVSDYERKVGTSVWVPAGDTQEVTTNCSPGKKVLGGGYATIDGFTDRFEVGRSYPGEDESSWTVFVRNTKSTDKAIRVYAICATVN